MNCGSALNRRLGLVAIATAFTLAASRRLPTQAAPVTLRDAAVSQGTGETSFDVEPTVWFQGFLADGVTGDPINATFDINAWMYSDEVGGTLLWGPELHRSVPIVDGWFNIELGAVEPPLPDFAATRCYLAARGERRAARPEVQARERPDGHPGGRRRRLVHGRRRHLPRDGLREHRRGAARGVAR